MLKPKLELKTRSIHYQLQKLDIFTIDIIRDMVWIMKYNDVLHQLKYKWFQLKQHYDNHPITSFERTNTLFRITKQILFNEQIHSLYRLCGLKTSIIQFYPHN